MNGRAAHPLPPGIVFETDTAMNSSNKKVRAQATNTA
jgi:hypothetical protein